MWPVGKPGVNSVRPGTTDKVAAHRGYPNEEDNPMLAGEKATKELGPTIPNDLPPGLAIEREPDKHWPMHSDQKLAETLADRGKDYGDYDMMCLTIQSLKSVLHVSPGWAKLSPAHQEALDMITTKMGRVVTGNPNKKDTWIDIQGYAKKAEESCK